MKARVITTGEIVEISTFQDNNKFPTTYDESELEFFVPNDYWTRLEHKAAIAAMQGLMTILPNIGGLEGRTPKDEIVDISMETAHALVEKYKEEERK